MESEIARASGSCIMAHRAGIVDYVSSEKIIVRADESEFMHAEDWISQGVDVYYLRKFQRSSHFTWIHQNPVVKTGDRVRAGDMLSSAAAISQGELSLGTNLLVAYMPWYGYNFEDAIVLNKRLVNDTLTSIFIDEYVVEARETKLGPEEITRDIPNVGESALEGLDEDGIVRVGTRVKTGDILVGKVTLKGDVQYSPEEKLLRAIFGEKSREVRDTSLRVPPGLEGTVVNVKIFSRSGVRKDKRYRDIVLRESAKLEADFVMQMTSVEKMVREKTISLLSNKKATLKLGKVALSEDKSTPEALAQMSLDELLSIRSSVASVNSQIDRLKKTLENQIRILRGVQEERLNRLKKGGDVLASGVIKMIKVYIATKRSIQVGDKLAGRHGNKGVVSTIVPSEDMPFLDDGRAVDVVLNPIGVPSRMNIGQILEAILGNAGQEIGRTLQAQIEAGAHAVVREMLEKYYGSEMVAAHEKSYGVEGLHELAEYTAKFGMRFKIPVFDGGSFVDDIQPLLRDMNIPEFGAMRIRDGRTGDYFDQPVTVGLTYIMKLNHMVDDKLHARSVGPYSLVTQQPLGGKAQKGGQRFGEMECWALEAYGAAYVLQEMLTYKSDDVVGRHKVYEAIVRGDDVPTPGLPESFNVLVKELQSLALRIDLFKTSKEESREQ
jgi:DNA-directed RNA polymerase subunit beta